MQLRAVKTESVSNFGNSYNLRVKKCLIIEKISVRRLKIIVEENYKNVVQYE